MNKEAIRKTAICYFSPADKCFVVKSPLFDMVIGAEKTEKDAWEIFNDLLDATYVNYLEGKLAGYTKAGRPKKNRVSFHAEIKPESKGELKELSEKLSCSQGEVIDFLLFSHSLKSAIKKTVTKSVTRRRSVTPKKTWKQSPSFTTGGGRQTKVAAKSRETV